MVIASEATQAQHGGAALPTHINQIWNMDFAANILFDGRKLRMLTIVDCITRESQ